MCALRCLNTYQNATAQQCSALLKIYIIALFRSQQIRND